MCKQSQTVKSSETDTILTPFKCDIMVIMIINPFVWHVWIYCDFKTPGAVGMSKRSKVTLIPTESD